MFSPWKFNVDSAAAEILARYGWSMPDGDEYPTGHDLVARYLDPLAGTSELADHIRLNTRVVTVARQDHDLMKNGARDDAPFRVRVLGPRGEEDVLARAVIDGSGDDASLHDALAEYQATRNRLSLPLFNIVNRIATQQWNDVEIGGLLIGLSSAMNEELATLLELEADPVA